MNVLKGEIEKYIKMGLPVFPVKGKRPPIGLMWGFLQERLPTQKEVDDWFEKYKDITGVAIALGNISGMTVIDCDIKDPNKRCDQSVIDKLKTEGYPESLTGSLGSHFFVANNNELGFSSNAGVITGVDIKAQGGYVLLPPSIALYGQDEIEYSQFNGNEYKWVREYKKGETLKPFPVWLLDLIKKNTTSKENNKVDLKQAIQGVGKGSRDNSAISVAGKFLYGLKMEEWKSVGLPALKGWNLQNEPPLSEEDIEKVFYSASKMESERRIPAMEIEKTLPPEYIELKTAYIGDAGVGILKISEFLINKYHFKTIAGRVDELYVYKDGIYSSDESGKIIRRESQLILQNKFSPHNINLITSQVAAQTYFDGSREEFENNSEHLICIDNGILNLLTKELIPHSPDHIFLSKIPIIFNPAADCPITKDFINNIFNEEDVPVIQEWIGYTLYRKYIFKKALILLGERDSGKTTFVECLKAFMGKSNHCALSLQEICFDSFAIKNLYAKFLNTYDDLNFSGIKDAGKLKMVTGGGTISGDVKFGDRVTFNNYAKLVFATNQIPQVKQNDPAYYSRWIIINCENSFSEDNPKTDRQIISKITTKEEQSGLLNWALEGFERLMANKKFSYGFSVEDVQIIMEKSGSSIASFAHDKLEENIDNWVSKDDMYKEYEKYVVDKKISPRLTKSMLGRELNRYAPYILDSRKGTIKGWRNVSTVKNSEPETPSNSINSDDFFKTNADYLPK